MEISINWQKNLFLNEMGPKTDIEMACKLKLFWTNFDLNVQGRCSNCFLKGEQKRGREIPILYLAHSKSLQWNNWKRNYSTTHNCYLCSILQDSILFLTYNLGVIATSKMVWEPQMEGKNIRPSTLPKGLIVFLAPFSVYFQFKDGIWFYFGQHFCWFSTWFFNFWFIFSSTVSHNREN